RGGDPTRRNPAPSCHAGAGGRQAARPLLRLGGEARQPRRVAPRNDRGMP
ncbi:hypothetical protein HMPREF0731_4149, partial [Pseudoroseomonas cervicalis ATCC 49957]